MRYTLELLDSACDMKSVTVELRGGNLCYLTA